jgi:hypothetical protein
MYLDQLDDEHRRRAFNDCEHRAREHIMTMHDRKEGNHHRTGVAAAAVGAPAILFAGAGAAPTTSGSGHPNGPGVERHRELRPGSQLALRERNLLSPGRFQRPAGVVTLARSSAPPHPSEHS